MQPTKILRRRRGYASRIRWAAGLAVAALLIGGGSVLGAQLAGGRPANSATALLTANAPAAASGQLDLAAVLGGQSSSAALSAVALANGQASRALASRGGQRRCLAEARRLRATGHRAAARAKLRSCIRGFRRLRLLPHGIHGQLTIKTKSGFRTFAFERGVISSVSGSSVVVKAADGTTWTWHFFAKTIVVRARHRVGTAALAAGEQVFVIGPVVNGADDARLIVIRR